MCTGFTVATHSRSFPYDKRAWARLIKQVYEVDPLVCPRCAGPMRIIAFIEQPEVIEKILTHLALWPGSVHSPPVQSLAA